MRDLRLALFHARMFATNSYFRTLLLTSTITLVLMQNLSARAADTHVTDTAWLQAGTAGLWTVCVVSAGLVGFQRYQGTLGYLVAGALPPGRTLAPLVASASLFGLLSYPLAALTTIVAGGPVALPSPGRNAMFIALTWCASMSLSCAIAALFVLTPNAITYEVLIGVPVVLLSGIFGTPSWLRGLDPLLCVLLPLRAPATALLGTSDWSDLLSVLVSVGSTALWAVIAIYLGGQALRRALVLGTLEVV